MRLVVCICWTAVVHLKSSLLQAVLNASPSHADGWGTFHECGVVCAPLFHVVRSQGCRVAAALSPPTQPSVMECNSHNTFFAKIKPHTAECQVLQSHTEGMQLRWTWLKDLVAVPTQTVNLTACPALQAAITCCCYCGASRFRTKSRSSGFTSLPAAARSIAAVVSMTSSCAPARSSSVTASRK